MRFFLASILFIILFGALGIAALAALVVLYWGPILLIVLAYVFRYQIKAGVEWLTNPREGDHHAEQ